MHNGQDTDLQGTVQETEELTKVAEVDPSGVAQHRNVSYSSSPSENSNKLEAELGKNIEQCKINFVNNSQINCSSNSESFYYSSRLFKLEVSTTLVVIYSLSLV